MNAPVLNPVFSAGCRTGCTRHFCGICLQSTVQFEFHHIVDWAKLKHHDPKYMLALCGNCHGKCTVGMIDRKAQQVYKAKLQQPVYRTEELDEVEIKRERDLATLRGLFSRLPRGAVQDFFDQAAVGYMPYAFSTYYWESFSQMLGSVNFHLYDTTADRLIREFACPVDGMMSISTEHMDLVPSGHRLRFVETLENLGSPKWHEAVKVYPEFAQHAANAWQQLYTYLRQTYLQLDFDLTDATAVQGYQKSHDTGSK